MNDDLCQKCGCELTITEVMESLGFPLCYICNRDNLEKMNRNDYDRENFDDYVESLVDQDD